MMVPQGVDNSKLFQCVEPVGQSFLVVVDGAGLAMSGGQALGEVEFLF